ncbi:KRAB-A domain-containing protein 2-like [Palaemon carinicauda]|uniref:KRAB-A domain-containing protein 2-like n=1 Tax=Palaemon carinicauda TaxID=392227 RepID=UPI0035B662FB
MQKVATMLEERVLAYMGPPRIFHSDNGREFINSVLQALFEEWGGDTLFVHGRSRHFQSHFQSQGCVENGNKVVEQKLAAMRVDNEGDDFPWAGWLPKVMFAMNTVTCETTKSSPFQVLYGEESKGNILPGARTGVAGEEEIF